MQDFHTDYIPN